MKADFYDYDIVDGLAVLRDGPNVDGLLDLSDHDDLTALPDGLSVGGYLYLDGCTSLKALPVGLTVGGSLNLSGCSSLTALPEGLTVGEWIITDHFTYRPLDSSLDLFLVLPETVLSGLPGMRVYQIIDHPWLRNLGLSDLVVLEATAWSRGIALKLSPALEYAA